MALSVNAQTFVDDLRKTEVGKGKVTVQQGKEIDELVNGATPAPVKNNEIETTKPETHPSSVKTNESNPSDAIDTEVVVDTRKKVMRNSYKTTGYRIQVFSGGNSRNDRQKAEKAGVDMKRMFPNEPIYVHFYSPSWKCRMGNYRSASEAQRFLKQVKTMYPQACIVKGTISVQY